MPSDHWIEKLEAFTALALRGAEICEKGVWVTFGITPTIPAIGYGYIEANTCDGYLFDVRSFTEKPDLATAKTYLESGKYFWNSGIFMVQAGSCLESFRRHQPELSKAATSCWEGRKQNADEDILAKPDLETIKAISVDYAIMEKEDRIALLPFDGGWSDVGSWDTLSRLISSNAPDLKTESFLVNSKNVFIYGNGRTIAGVGIEDLIIVDDDNATLILRQGHSEKVTQVIDALVEVGNSSANEHSFEHRPWGMFENLLDSDICKVKRLTIDPWQHLSLQYHHKRSKHWVVVAGRATVQLNGETFTLEAGQSIDIPLGAIHSLGNDTDTPVVVIEVQMGSYFGEDDIVRVSDPYGR